MPAYQVVVMPMSTENSQATDTVFKGVAKQEMRDNRCTFVATQAQIQGVLNYCGLIKAGSATSTVETAINALSP